MLLCNRHEKTFKRSKKGDTIMYLDIDLQGNIGQVLLAHSEHMLGQATL
jgi:hypothetical protein